MQLAPVLLRTIRLNFGVMHSTPHRKPLAGPIVLVLADGIGGADEFALARTPYLTAMAQDGTRGDMLPIGVGIVPTPARAYRAILGRRYDLRSAIASHQELGMDVIECGPSLEAQIDSVRSILPEYDLLVIPYSHIDRAARAGHLPGKVEMIERLDSMVPTLQKLNAAVLIITGAWSTPTTLKKPSWHPVPLILWSEHANAGEIGRIHGDELLPLAIAHAEGWSEVE